MLQNHVIYDSLFSCFTIVFVKRYVFLLQITAVCDFYTYARYITQGLVKSDGKIQFSKMIYDEVTKVKTRE